MVRGRRQIEGAHLPDHVIPAQNFQGIKCILQPITTSPPGCGRRAFSAADGRGHWVAPSLEGRCLGGARRLRCSLVASSAWPAIVCGALGEARPACAKAGRLRRNFDLGSRPFWTSCAPSGKPSSVVPDSGCALGTKSCPCHKSDIASHAQCDVAWSRFREFGYWEPA